MGGIGGPELLLVFLVVLLVFGPSRLPEVARGIGKGLAELRRLTTELAREINLSGEEPPPRRRIGPPASGPVPGPLTGPPPAPDEPPAESPAEPPTEEERQPRRP